MIRFLIIFTVITLCIIIPLYAEERSFSTNISLTLSQSAYSDNWVGEELGTVSWVINSKTRASRHLSELILLKSNLTLAFGQTHQQQLDEDGKKSWEKAKKSSDKIDWDNLFILQLKKYVDPFFSIRWESQFIDKSDSENTLIINPMRFTDSLGITKEIINLDDHQLSARLGGAFRQTLDRSDSVQDDLVFDGGIELINEYRGNLDSGNINFSSRLILYQALYNSEGDDIDDDWKSLDITWENSIITKLWTIINLSFNFDLIFDKEQDKDVQFRQLLGLGLVWQF